MRRCRVLLVEDEPVLLGATARLLSSEFEVSTAQSLDAAIASFEQNAPPDILVTDLDIGRDSGETLLHYVRLQFPEVARVVVSGADEPRLRQLSVSGLADAVVNKAGSDPAAILQTLRALCAARSP